MEKENYDIYNCLELFTKEEVLDKDNEWYNYKHLNFSY